METVLFPLQRAYNDYCQNKMEKKELETKIVSCILECPQRFYLNRWKQDETFDFLCWVYPRLGRSIDRYKDQGSTFDAYIGSVIRMSYKEFYLQKKDKAAMEYSWWNARAEELYAASDVPHYDGVDVTSSDAERSVIMPVKNQRQVLFLLLKCYYFLSEDFVDKIAPALNIHKDELIMMINNLHELRKRQEDEIDLLRRRINSQYYRCLCFESRMKAAPEGSAHFEKMKRCLDRGRMRLRSMRKHLSRMRLNASNRQVAELLGVPKGTIDSSLHALKEKKQDD
jgi:hypothetical protein